MWEVSKELVDPYLQACKDSVNSQKAFNSFRRDDRLHPILEHVSYEEGLLYLKEIKDSEFSVSNISCKAKENDLVGNPFLYDYPEIGFICPTTIRYAKNVYDIAYAFSQTVPNIENVVEIGGGYGGLCRLMTSLFSIKQYLLVDFEDVNNLSKKYLQYYYEKCNGIGWIVPDELEEVKNIQMCISNYCFSECDRETQEMYYNKIIKNSSMFYITYNHISDKNMSDSEFIKLASQHFRIHTEEEVRDGHKNIIMYGLNYNDFPK
jgi:hypothetical protein